MSLLENAKVRLRISHSKLDNDILALIESAKEEMKRVGILESIVDEEENKPLIENAILTFVCMEYTTDEKKHARYKESWIYQIDNLRKSLKYGYEV